MMELEKAIDIVKWGPYARPAPTEAQKKQALDVVLEHPEVWEELLWSHKNGESP